VYEAQAAGAIGEQLAALFLFQSIFFFFSFTYVFTLFSCFSLHIGCIIYSDPADDGFVRANAVGENTFPEGPWRPANGVQRGSIWLGKSFNRKLHF
jgi:hypothetical protein